MHSSELTSFAAHLRGFIRASIKGTPTDWARFDSLALELFGLQFKHNAPYRRLCEARGVTPESLDDWTEIPAVPTVAFKELELSCLSKGERTAVFHSSGTTEQRPSRHYHSGDSLALYEESLWAWFEAHCQSEVGDLRLIILTPPQAQAPHSSLVHMFETIRCRLGAEPAAFVGRAERTGVWSLDVDEAVELLRQATAARQPALVLGTAFSFVHLVDSLAERELGFQLPAGSCALETGGYKGRSRSLPKPALHTLISQRLGICVDRIVCEYGMSELSSQAYDRAIASAGLTQHGPPVFQFPPWARVQIVSPETGDEVTEGETGLIRVFDLANVCSVMAIQTEDLGVRHGNGFTLAGRATLAEPRGCSLMVA